MRLAVNGARMIVLVRAPPGDDGGSAVTACCRPEAAIPHRIFDHVPMLSCRLFFCCTIALSAALPHHSRAYGAVSTDAPSDVSRIIVITPATTSVREAFCYIGAKRSIERTALMQFPMAAGIKLYGVLKMRIVIGSDGTLVDSSVVQSSGNAELDRAAKAIVVSAAPFGYCVVKREYAGAPKWVIEYRFSFETESVTTKRRGDSG